MKVKKLLKSLFLPIDCIRIVCEKNIFNTHKSDETFKVLELPEEYMSMKIKDFYIESYTLNDEKMIALNIKI